MARKVEIRPHSSVGAGRAMGALGNRLRLATFAKASSSLIAGAFLEPKSFTFCSPGHGD